jgi:hypothetical protein
MSGEVMEIIEHLRWKVGHLEVENRSLKHENTMLRHMNATLENMNSGRYIKTPVGYTVVGMDD